MLIVCGAMAGRSEALRLEGRRPDPGPAYPTEDDAFRSIGRIGVIPKAMRTEWARWLGLWGAWCASLWDDGEICWMGEAARESDLLAMLYGIGPIDIVDTSEEW